MAPQQSSTTMSTSVEHVHPVILWTAGDHSEVERKKQNNCVLSKKIQLRYKRAPVQILQFFCVFLNNNTGSGAG